MRSVRSIPLTTLLALLLLLGIAAFAHATSVRAAQAAPAGRPVVTVARLTAPGDALADYRISMAPSRSSSTPTVIIRNAGVVVYRGPASTLSTGPEGRGNAASSSGGMQISWPVAPPAHLTDVTPTATFEIVSPQD